MAKNINSNKKASMTPSNKKTAKKKNKKKKSKVGKFIKRTILVLFLLGLTLSVVGLGYVVAIIKSTPDLNVDAVLNLSEPSSLYDNNGDYIDTLHSEVNRNSVEFDKIPQELKDAYISIEDQRFYSHHGIDPKRIAGSIVTDIVKIINKQSGMHGGSTLTQQLLKNTVLNNENSRIERKIKEWYLALQLEKQLTKDQILNQYLNTIPLGGTTYGVDAAANYYFAKSVSDLNLIECAYIAGVTQAPTYYSAYTNKDNPDVYIKRTKTVLSKMLELDKITQDQYNQAITDLDNGGLQFSSTTVTYDLEYEWYVRPAVQQVKKDLMEELNYSEDEIDKLLANGGLKIYTNMDRSLQDSTQNILNNINTWTFGYADNVAEGKTTKALQASATIVDYKTGKVVAMVGGRGSQEDFGANPLNWAYSVNRSIGSSTKPLTVYGPSINEKVLTAASPIEDSVETSKYLSQKYSGWGNKYPNNDDFCFSGTIPLREGLRQSKNVVALAVEDKIGIDTGLYYGKKFGINYGTGSKTLVATSLGEFQNSDEGSNTYTLSSAFGVFGNNGVYTEPKLYSKVKDAYGKTILDAESEQQEIFSPQTAYIMYDMLKGSKEFTGPSAQFSDMPVAGKTGTTTNSANLWFSGLTPYYSASVWVGNQDNQTSLKGNSNNVAAIWGQIMAVAHEGLEVKDIQMPRGIETAEICSNSGKLANNSCKASGTSYSEYFIEGTAPTSYCDSHVNSASSNENDKDEENKDKDKEKEDESKEDEKKEDSSDSTNADKTTNNSNNNSTTTNNGNNTTTSGSSGNGGNDDKEDDSSINTHKH